MKRSFWKGKKVFLTGHTGFKGSWLTLWLNSMGASVHGYALPISDNPNLFSVAQVGKSLKSSTIADIRDAANLTKTIQAIQPEIVIHMAAQPLVRISYQDPLATYEINVMGTVNLLEAIRQTPSVIAVVNVTTDKCYENREWIWSYRENEAMGGHDPYSSSKACSELVTAAYRRSYFKGKGIRLASARAGNVIGGGDWANERLIPDFLRALDDGKTLFVRSPQATRPWQHVLEPLAGYLMLAENLYFDNDIYADAWNFGPENFDTRTVQWIVDKLCQMFPDAKWETDSNSKMHEAHTLKIDSSKAKAILNWHSRWNLETALGKTVNWYKAWKEGRHMTEVCLDQIHEYESTACYDPSF